MVKLLNVRVPGFVRKCLLHSFSESVIICKSQETILFALVELYKFSTNFHRILAVLASASLSGVFNHLLLAS